MTPTPEDILTTYASGIMALIVLAVSVVLTYIIYKKTRESTEYFNVDTLYQQILQIGIDHPEFRNPKVTNNYTNHFQGNGKENEIIEYENYAYMVWNICETMCDNSVYYDEVKRGFINYHKLEKDENWISWFPSFKYEVELHHAWFSDSNNKSKFSEQFIKLIEILKKDGKIDV